MKLIDTNILIYSFDPESCFHGWAKSRLSECILNRQALVNPVILAELAAGSASGVMDDWELVEWLGRSIAPREKD